VLSEDAASLLSDRVRPAVLWTIDLDGDGDPRAVHLERARVRSRAQLDYAGVQSDVDSGRAYEPVRLLPEIGKLLTARAVARGAIDLPLPEQEVEPDGAGWRRRLRDAARALGIEWPAGESIGSFVSRLDPAADPPVRARWARRLVLGARLRVRVTRADPTTRTVCFASVSAPWAPGAAVRHSPA
jgi:hypothetical protein